MPNLTSGQTTDYILAPGGSRVTLSGYGKIQYSPGTLQDAKDGRLTFVDWPLGSSAGYCDLAFPVVIKVVAIGDCEYSVQEGAGVGRDSEQYWVSAESGDDSANMPVSASINPVTGGVKLSAVGTDVLASVATDQSGEVGRQYPAACDSTEWVLYGSGSGTATEVFDAEFGRTLRLTATSAGTKYSIGRDMVIDALAPVAFSFMAKKGANLSALDIEVGFAQFGFTKSIKLNKGVSYMGTGEWQRIAFSLAEYESVVGAPTALEKQDIRTVRVSITPTAGNTTVLDIADFRVHSATPGGVVGIFFDDGRADTYSFSYQEMKSRGMVGAIAVEYLAVGNADRCTLAQLQEMYAAGWDMCAHHTVGLTTLSASDQVAVHKGMRDFLATNGFSRADHIFVYPGGLRTLATDKISRGYWQVSRAVSAMTTHGAIGAFDPVRPPHRYVGKTFSLASAKLDVDRVKANGGSLTFVFHSIVDTPSATEDWAKSDFTALLNYIQEQGVPVLPISGIWTRRETKASF